MFLISWYEWLHYRMDASQHRLDVCYEKARYGTEIKFKMVYTFFHNRCPNAYIEFEEAVYSDCVGKNLSVIDEYLNIRFTYFGCTSDSLLPILKLYVQWK